MRKTFSLKKYFAGALAALAVIATGAFFTATPALADNGGIVINVKQELGTDLAGATVAIQCPGGTYTTLTTTDVSGNAAVFAAGVPVGANCGNGESVDARVTLAGYVTKTVTAIGTYATGSQNTYNVTNVLFTYRMELVTDELGGNIMPTSGTPWTASGGLTMAAQAYSAGKWYLALSGTGNLAFDLDGYVRANITATPSASAQTLESNFFDILFGHKVIIKDELGNALTPTTVTAGASNTSCTISGAAAYCPIVAADDDTLANGFVISKDGFVRSTASAVPLAVNRASTGDDQGITTMTTTNGLKYAVKVTVTALPANAALSGATVVTGNSLGVSCTENGSTGIYFCIVPLAHTGVIVDASKAGYSSGTESFTDRTSATDAQRTVAPVLAVISGGSGNSGGGGGSSTPSTPATPSEETPAPIVPAPTPAPVVTPAAPAVPSLTQMIASERDMLAGMANALAYFKATGTPSTLKLGAGERAAAVSSFKEAFGHDPKTSADWQDVLNIANGRWPLMVNAAVEARAYINFKAVYGRAANMKNSTDVNALKMMGYGVRSTKVRDLKLESAASARFKSVFGFAPTTARHWNIVRAIAYSGLLK